MVGAQDPVRSPRIAAPCDPGSVGPHRTEAARPGWWPSSPARSGSAGRGRRPGGLQYLQAPADGQYGQVAAEGRGQEGQLARRAVGPPPRWPVGRLAVPPGDRRRPHRSAPARRGGDRPVSRRPPVPRPSAGAVRRPCGVAGGRRRGRPPAGLDHVDVGPRAPGRRPRPPRATTRRSCR